MRTGHENDDPIATRAAEPRAITLVLHGERRPALSYDAARELLDELADLLPKLADLRDWATYVVEQDCAKNLRTEVRIGERVYTFKGGTAYAVERPDDLHAALAARVIAGDLTRAELDAAITGDSIPARVEWGLHNGRLNELVKRGGEVARAINAHRVTSTTPATLKPKGR